MGSLISLACHKLRWKLKFDLGLVIQSYRFLSSFIVTQYLHYCLCKQLFMESHNWFTELFNLFEDEKPDTF